VPPAPSLDCGHCRTDGTGGIRRPASIGRSKILERARRILQNEEGQTLVEYALIIGIVSITLVAALTGISDALGRAFDAITSTLSGVVGS